MRGDERHAVKSLNPLGNYSSMLSRSKQANLIGELYPFATPQEKTGVSLRTLTYPRQFERRNARELSEKREITYTWSMPPYNQKYNVCSRRKEGGYSTKTVMHLATSPERTTSYVHFLPFSHVASTNRTRAQFYSANRAYAHVLARLCHHILKFVQTNCA